MMAAQLYDHAKTLPIGVLPSGELYVCKQTFHLKDGWSSGQDGRAGRPELPSSMGGAQITATFYRVTTAEEDCDPDTQGGATARWAGGVERHRQDPHLLSGGHNLEGKYYCSSSARSCGSEPHWAPQPWGPAPVRRAHRTFGFEGQQGLLLSPRGLWERLPLLQGAHKISHAPGPRAEAPVGEYQLQDHRSPAACCGGT